MVSMGMAAILIAAISIIPVLAMGFLIESPDPSRTFPAHHRYPFILFSSNDNDNNIGNNKNKPPLECYIGLDVGTQGTKCVVYSPSEKKVVARSSHSYGLEPTTVQGRAEQSPQKWLDAVAICLEQISHSFQSRKIQVAGVGVSGQQHGLVALDDTMTPVMAAKLWCDVEATHETLEIQRMTTSLHVDRTYLTPSFTAPKILWMKRHHPQLFDQTRWFVLPHDYIVQQLASLKVPITDAGDASGNGLFDTVTRQNVPELAEMIDPTLMTKLPTIIDQPNAIAGYLNNHYRNLLKIPTEAPPIPISIGSGDNMCAALGVGCVQEGQAVMSLGTSGTLFGCTRQPAPLHTPLSPFCDATGQHLPLACTISCTSVLTQVLETSCPPGATHESVSHQLMQLQNSRKLPIGCDGVTFLPYLGGERTPNWPHATGALLGLTSQHLIDTTTNNNSKEYFGLLWYRACMEAITFCLADTLQYFPSSSKKLDQLYVVGGGARNPLWRQIIADIVQCTLQFPVETESAALGAALQAGAAATGTDVKDYVLQQDLPMEPDTVQPNPDNFKEYQDALLRYRTLGKALFGNNK